MAFKHLSVALILVWSPLMATPVAAHDKAAPSASPQAETSLFAVLYRPGPNWKVGQPMQNQDLRGHAEYYKEAFEQGRVFAGGALARIDGGLAILRMSSLGEAQAFLAADPALLNGTFVGEVHAWTPRFVADGPMRP